MNAATNSSLNICLKNDILESTNEKAAVQIQKIWRGYKVRKAFLPRKLFSLYRRLCGNSKALSNMPRAAGGDTPVFLPQEVPQIVIKYTGRKKAITRFHLMQQAREILLLQKSTHLVVPKARLFGEFLIEERLPINYKASKHIYYLNRNLFGEAAREFVRFYTKAHIGNLLSRIWYKGFIGRHKNDPRPRYLSGAIKLRYDNIPFYIENGEGKIGLIDLERLKLVPKEGSIYQLARIFFYNPHELLAEAATQKLNQDRFLIYKCSSIGRSIFKKEYDPVGYYSKLMDSMNEPMRDEMQEGSASCCILL